MATLSAIRKQIKRLEAEAERITKQEMSGAISKIKSLMSDFGITMEHLSGKSAPAAAKRAASEKVASKKRAGVGVARYADPKTGKTWTGFGRAPAWIADAKDRDAFLIGSAVAEPGAAAPAKRAKKTAAAPTAKKVAKVAKAAKKIAKKAPKKVAAAAKKAPAAKKSAAAKKAASEAPAAPAAAKKVARKAPKKTPAKAAKKVASKKAAATSAPAAAAGDAEQSVAA